MNMTLNEIKPETLALIEKQSKAFGMTVDEYLKSLLSQGENYLTLDAEKDSDRFESDMNEFAEEIQGNYNGSYSREDIYFDHD